MIAATRKTVSWPRKAFHLGFISTMGLGLALSGIDRTGALALVGILLAIVGGLDLLRLRWPEFNERVLRDFAAILRREEEHRVAASTWVLLGALATIALAPLPYAALSFLYLAVGDPVASWIGVRFGRIELPGGKSLEGSLAMVAACAALGTAFLVFTHTVSLAVAPLVALGGAFAAALAEWLPLGPVDDNFRVPVAAAAALAGAAAYLAPTITV